MSLRKFNIVMGACIAPFVAIMLLAIFASTHHLPVRAQSPNPIYLPAYTQTLESSVLATGTFTTGSIAVVGKTYDVVITYAGITGAPLTCTLQPQVSADNVNFVNNGSATSLAAPATGTVVAIPTGVVVGAYNKFIYACGTYPTGGTATVNEVFHSS